MYSITLSTRLGKQRKSHNHLASRNQHILHLWFWSILTTLVWLAEPMSSEQSFLTTGTKDECDFYVLQPGRDYTLNPCRFHRYNCKDHFRSCCQSYFFCALYWIRYAYIPLKVIVAWQNVIWKTPLQGFLLLTDTTVIALCTMLLTLPLWGR